MTSNHFLLYKMNLSHWSRRGIRTLVIGVVVVFALQADIAAAQWWGSLFRNSNQQRTSSPATTATTDTTPPKLTKVTLTSKVFPEYKGSIFAGDQATLSFTSNEALQKPVVKINGRAATVTGSEKIWTAKIFMQRNDAAGPVSFSIQTKDKAGNAAAPVTTVTSGTKPSFVKTPSPTYCLYARQFTSTPLTYTGSYTRSYVLDAQCPPKANIAIFSAKVGTTPAYTATARSNNTLKIEKDCGWFGFSCDKEMKVKYGTTQSTSGSLPPFILPNQSLTLSWQCQPFQVMLWKKDDYNWWGLNDQDSIAATRFNYSTTPTGTGFDTGGKLTGSVVVKPTNTTTYKINCGSSNYKFPEIKILVDNPQGSITASPLNVRPNGTATVFWSATNVKDNSCRVTDSSGRAVAGTAGINVGPGGGVKSGALTIAMSPATFTLTCKRYGGEQITWTSNPVTVISTCQTTYSSNRPNDCSFNTTASTLEGGKVDARYYCPATNQSYRIESSTNNGVTWSSVTNGTVPTSGNRERTYTIANGDGPINNTTYRLTCVSTGGNSAGTDQTAVAAPVLTLKAAPTTLSLLGGTVSNITWTSQNVNSNSCTVTSEDTGVSLGSGNSNNRGVRITPTTLPVSYEMTCKTPASVKGRTPDPTRILTIYETGTEPTLEIDLDPLQVRRDGTTTLTWTGTNLPGTCTLSTAPSIPTLNPTVNSTPTGSGSGVDIGPIAQNTNVTLTCGPVSDTENVGLLPEYREI